MFHDIYDTERSSALDSGLETWDQLESMDRLESVTGSTRLDKLIENIEDFNLVAVKKISVKEKNWKSATM